MRSSAETERAATQFVDDAIQHLLCKRRALADILSDTTVTPTEHRALGTAVTPSRVASLALTEIGYQLRRDLAFRYLQQIARSRLNVEFHVLLQAQALATVRRPPASIVAGRTVTLAAA